MRRYAKDNKINEPNTADVTKDTVDFNDEKNNIFTDSKNIESKENDETAQYNQDKSSERKLSRRLLGIEDTENFENRRRSSRGTGKHSARQDRNKKDSKVISWLYNSVFTVGHIRVTRLFAITSFLVLALAVSGFALWLFATDVLEKKMPIENPELIPSEKIVYIQDEGETVLVKTEEDKVIDVVESEEIVLNENDLILPDESSQIYNRMTLHIKRAKNVTIQAGSEEHNITFYSGTVEDALKEAGISYDEDDIVEPSLNTEVKSDTDIKLDIVEVETVTEEVVIEFETEYGETSTVLKGMYAVTQKGVDGLAEVTYEVTYVNGEETGRKAVEEVMIKEPVNRVELHGTALTRIGEGDDDEEPSVSVKNPDEQSTNPTVPGTSSTYVDIVSCMVTAYTHTGHTTATGTWPRSTRTLENPGSCAVVPDTFPYGSLLYVTGYGYCIAEDTGGFRHDPDRWNQIDVFMNTVDECLTWGRRRDVKVYVIRYGY